MKISNVQTLTGDMMREVPKSTLPDEALDKDKCRKAIDAALARPEPEKAFDRQAWLENTKAQLKPHASASK